MGLGVSKCCKERPSDDAARAERTPLNDAERGSAGAGTSGRATSDRDDPSSARPRAGTPVDPDPDVFYAKPQSRSSPSFVGGHKSRRDRRSRGGPSDTARETSSGAPDKTRRATKHHQRSNARVGEERILKFHKEHPDEAPLLGSSSEEEFDADGQPIPKNWIGVCPAKLQHRVWWWSITFVLCFIAGMGVFLGLSHAYELRRDAPVSPAPNLNPRRPFDDADTLRSQITTAAAAPPAPAVRRACISPTSPTDPNDSSSTPSPTARRASRTRVPSTRAPSTRATRPSTRTPRTDEDAGKHAAERGVHRVPSRRMSRIRRGYSMLRRARI